ncbi:MAG: 16S rRNA (guanine(527)-N(7))-methyltransferase RsmG, partial [Actinomycetes bacterium]
DRLALAERFVDHLATSGLERGLLGPRELPRIWSRHVLNCAVIADLIPAGTSVIDIGSGAGLPGLALAIVRPDLQITLVEPFERRSLWLAEVAQDLDVGVQVVRARAEDLAGRRRAGLVTARAVAPLPKLLRWGLPLVAAHGQLLAIKGRSALHELEEAGPALRRLGVQDADVVTCGDGVLEPPTTVVRVRVAAGASARAASPAGRARRAQGERRRR